MTEYLKTPGAPLLTMVTQTQTQTQEPVVRTVYKRVKIPTTIYEYVRNRAKARGMPMWQYILQSVNFYESSLRNVSVSDATKAQNASYYVIKATMAITEFIHKPKKDNYDKVVKILNQIKERKKVDTTVLLQLIERYYNKRRKSLIRVMMQELIRINVELMSKNQ
jgi:hypothetical protein